MSDAELHVELGNSAADGGVSNFLVHVDGVSSGQVSQDNSVVLDGSSLLLEDLKM